MSLPDDEGGATGSDTNDGEATGAMAPHCAEAVGPPRLRQKLHLGEGRSDLRQQVRYVSPAFGAPAFAVARELGERSHARYEGVPPHRHH
jgi:hypothetical protein